MAIDDSGDWWIGSVTADIEVYLAAYTANGDGYPATVFWPVVCPCGSDRFRLARANSITQRTCVSCKEVRYIDRFGHGRGWQEAVADQRKEAYSCVGCRGKAVNVCLGFADYTRHPGFKKGDPLPDAVLWFFVGVRCLRCGILGCFNDGKVGRGPMAEATFREIAGERPHTRG